MWQDIIVSRILLKSELVKGLCTIFSVTASEIFIEKDINNVKNAISDNIRLICQTWVSKSEFPFSISIYLRDQSLYLQNNKLQDDINKIGQFCETLNCEALIGDDTVNPYSWLLIKSRTEYSPIYIEIDAFDNREPYELDES